MYKDPDEVSLRAPLLTCLSALIAGFAPSKSTPTGSSVTFDPPPISHADGSSPLESYRDELLSIFTSGSRSAFSRPPALAGLVHLVEIPGFLSSSEVTFCGSALNDVLSAAESESDYDLSLSGLIKVAKLYPRIVETSTLPILFALLPSSAPSSSSSESEIYRRSLTSLASLSLHPDLFEILSLRLLARLEGVCASSFPDPLEQSNNSLYAHHLLATLRAVLAQKAEKGHEDIQKYVEKLVPRLFAIFVLPTVTSMDKGEVAKDARLLADVGEVVASIIQKVDVA
jgi:DNA repair/transcription protein MET18/MMS19